MTQRQQGARLLDVLKDKEWKWKLKEAPPYSSTVRDAPRLLACLLFDGEGAHARVPAPLLPSPPLPSPPRRAGSLFRSVL